MSRDSSRLADNRALLVAVSTAALLAATNALAQAPPSSPAPGPAVRIDTEAMVPELSTILRASTSELRDVVERYDSDRDVLLRRYDDERSPDHRARLGEFTAVWQSRLASVDFAALSQEGRIDYLLLRKRLGYERHLLEQRDRMLEEARPLLPFAATILELHDARRRLEPLDARAAASTLARLAEDVEAARKAFGSTGVGAYASTAGTVVVHRAAQELADVSRLLQRWFEYYDGYDPAFTWWAGAPFRKAHASIQAYEKTLREKAGAGGAAGEDEPIVGNPIGREALRTDLGFEWIPYTPEELEAVAARELSWCEAEMKKAARDMGCGEDWKAALEKVKQLHVEPGRQPDLIRDLAREAVAFIQERGLLTVPALAKDVWRMEMMSPERQKVLPFFSGGEVIHVSFPTGAMAHDDKLMSLRGNNVHFSRATVHHEVIPGHHLQQFMTARYNAHRRVFSTPFWTEGWALYWEMLLWDLQFARSAENRVGMLFWRMHRCARVLFSLGFHTGKMTPQECIDFLVDRVGHERANATAEVRRSFNGSYPPLYQLAYLMGGLQFRELRRELVASGKMTDRAFHDAILQGGNIPVEMVRARLAKLPLTRETQTTWRFAGEHPDR